MELADHREDFGGDHRLLHPQLHLVVPDHAPGVYATVAAHVNAEASALRSATARVFGIVGGALQPLSAAPRTEPRSGDPGSLLPAAPPV